MDEKQKQYLHVQPQQDEPDTDQTTPPAPRPQSTSAERVIQPLDASLTTTTTSAQPVPRPALATPHVQEMTDVPSYDPSTTGYQEHKKPSGTYNATEPERLSAQHKSVLLLAIMLLVLAAYSTFAVLSAQQTAQELVQKGTLESQPSFALLWADVLLQFGLGMYFMFAKSRSFAATILLIFIILQFIAVFGIFWGQAGDTNYVTLILDFALLIYLFVVRGIVKAPRPI